MRRILIAALLMPVAAYAHQPKALHNKAWYEAHDAEREATLGLCHSDASYAHLYDCQNAEAAGNVVLQRVAPGDFLNTPGYWAANPTAAQMELRICAQRPPGSEPYLRYCQVAALSQSWTPR